MAGTHAAAAATPGATAAATTAATTVPAAVSAQRRWGLLLVLTAAPHSSDVVTTTLRLAQAALDQGHTVRIWACGYSTMLTQTGHGDSKLPNTRRPDVVYPSPPTVVREMLRVNERRLAWIACTACSAERGAVQHIPEVRLRSPARFASTITSSEKTIFIGGA